MIQSAGKILVLLAITLSASFAQAVSEEKYSLIFDLIAQGEGSFYKHSAFTTTDRMKIAFTKFGDHRGTVGSLVILPGRTESSLKYIEVAYDLIQKGFSPVFVINHRGQGFSQRELKNQQKGHISDFSKYETDFAQFLEIIQKDSDIDNRNLFALSHSMGASILTNYLSRNPNPFKAAALIAPLFRILNQKTEGQILNETFVACYIQRSCDEFIPDGGPFRWENRNFANNDLTHSHTRFIMRDHLWRTWPELQIGDPTVRWVRETVQANIKQRKQAHLTPITLPIQMYRAEQDQVVEKTAQSEVCGKIGKNCKLFKVLRARHEILMETDRLRNAALSHISSFFKDHSKLNPRLTVQDADF